MSRQDRADLRSRLDRSDRRGMRIERPLTLLERYNKANKVICGRIARAIVRLEGISNG
jgi:hypothetical protein